MATTTTQISAKDGIPRAPSDDPSVHRALVVVDPPMQGRDVANLQRAARARLEARGFDDDIAVPNHGKFTPATAFACLVAAALPRAALGDLPARDEHGHRVVTEGAQRILRHPDERDDKQLARAKTRQAHAKQSPASTRSSPPNSA